MDVKFPLIQYTSSDPRQCGIMHGEGYRAAIQELASIRKDLLRKSHTIWTEERIHEEALCQSEINKNFDADLHAELQGIADGAQLSMTDLVVLNNYTDFRDLHCQDQGCSTVYFANEDQCLAGQTWDMHKSARDYLCLIEIPASEHTPRQLVMSVVGCVGLTGLNEWGAFVGVNNLKTSDATSGILWPSLVRKMLKIKTLAEMRSLLVESPVTSGHNYLIGDAQDAEMWEITPQVKAHYGRSEAGQKSSLFHTNHCLTKEAKAVEQKNLSKTTHARFDLLAKKMHLIQDESSLLKILHDHENYPNSICTHDVMSDPDASETCGGAIYNLQQMKAYFWRGCDKNPHLCVEHTLGFT